MRLPAEIRDEVVSYFLLPDILDRYPEKDYETLDWDSFKTLGPSRAVRIWQSALQAYAWKPTRFYQLELDVDSLLSLRLVSHDWHSTATGLLEKHHSWYLRFDLGASITRAIRSCRSSSSISSSSHRPPLRSLESPISNLVLDDAGSVLSFRRIYQGIICDNDPQYEDKLQWLSTRGYHWEPYEAPNPLQLHYDKTNTHEGLRQIFDALGQIKTFSLVLPSAGADYYRGREDGEEDWADCYDLIALEEIAATFSYAFTNSIAFQHITDLRFQLPSTHYVGQLASALDQAARARLKHLKIEITDATGSCGSRDYSSSADPDDREDMADGVIDDNPDNDETNFPYSNVQRLYPNRTHQDVLWAFVRSCHNLDSLFIHATHFLDLNLLDYRAALGPDWRGLQTLALNRVYVSADALLSLIRPRSKALEKSQLCRIYLKEVKMHADGGNWDTVLNFLKDDCPQLECGKFYNMTYFTQHENYGHNHRIHENVDSLWSESGKDKRALTSLAGKLVERVGPGNYYPEHCLDNIDP